jgi:hypothetical protein
MNATDITPDVERVYKIYAPTFIGTMNGINCWTIVSTQHSGLDDNAIFGTQYDNCEACTTTTTAAPTTTTTTAAPFYQIVGYATTYGDACDNPISSFPMTGNGTTFCNSTTFTSATWNSIATGNYVVAYNGNYQQVSHTFGQGFATVYGGGCTACPTTTTSTTTTTAATTYNYYTLTRYNCPNCSGPLNGLIGRNNTTGGTLTTGYYYNNGDGYVYKITGYSAGSYYDIDLDGSASQGTDCAGTCAI